MTRRTVTTEWFARDYAEQMRWLGTTPPSVESTERNLRLALEEWSALIGREFVLDDEPTRTHYSQTTLPKRTTPAAIVRPSTTEEVQHVVRVAAKYGIKWHTISRGKNWGHDRPLLPCFVMKI